MDQHDERQHDDQHDDQQPTPGDGPAFRLETVFDAEPAHVWHALTDPATLGEWLGCPVDVSLEADAEGTIGVDSDAVTVLVVEEVVVERRLVFRWASATDPPSVVELDLHPLGDRTRLTIVERPLPDGRVVGATAMLRRVRGDRRTLALAA